MADVRTATEADAGGIFALAAATRRAASFYEALGYSADASYFSKELRSH